MEKKNINKNEQGGMNRRDFMKKSSMALGAALTAGLITPKIVKPARAASRNSILIGRPVPKTGPIAAFAESTPWLDNRALDEINKDGGIYIKEFGKKVPLEVKILDTESNPTKAAEIGSRLIVRDKIDMMYVSSTPATVNPVAGVCERYQIPSISTMMPVEMFLQGGPHHFSYNENRRTEGVGGFPPRRKHFTGAHLLDGGNVGRKNFQLFNST